MKVEYPKILVWRPVNSVILNVFKTLFCHFKVLFKIFSWARIPTSQSKKAGPKIKRSPYLKFQGRSQGQLKNKNFDISSKPIVMIMTKPFLVCWNPLFKLFVISSQMLNFAAQGRRHFDNSRISFWDNIYSSSFNPAVGRGIAKFLLSSLWIHFTMPISFYPS